MRGELEENVDHYPNVFLPVHLPQTIAAKHQRSIINAANVKNLSFALVELH